MGIQKVRNMGSTDSSLRGYTVQAPGTNCSEMGESRSRSTAPFPYHVTVQHYLPRHLHWCATRVGCKKQWCCERNSAASCAAERATDIDKKIIILTRAEYERKPRCIIVYEPAVKIYAGEVVGVRIRQFGGFGRSGIPISRCPPFSDFTTS